MQHAASYVTFLENASADEQIRSPFATRIKTFCDTLDETAERVFCGCAAAGCIATRTQRPVGHQKYRSIELFTLPAVPTAVQHDLNQDCERKHEHCLFYCCEQHRQNKINIVSELQPLTIHLRSLCRRPQHKKQRYPLY